MARATGGPMSIAPYLAYLRGKYGEFYRLPEPQPAGDAGTVTIVLCWGRRSTATT